MKKNESSKSNKKKLTFDQNWNNKLNCKAFTTIRLHSMTKNRVGEKYYIYLNDKWIGIAEMIEVETILGSQLDNRTWYINSGNGVKATVDFLRQVRGVKDVDGALFDICLMRYMPVEKNDRPTQVKKW